MIANNDDNDNADDDMDNNVTNVNYMSEEEISWALQIKSAVQDDEKLIEMSDFDYASFALHTKGDIELALYKIHGIQEFRKEYKVRDEYDFCRHQGGDDDDDDNDEEVEVEVEEDATVQEGMDCLRAYMEQMPGLVLDVEHDTEFGHHVLVLDYANLNPSVCHMPKDWRIQLSGLYFLHSCIQPNLHSIRQGIIRICELDGVSWKNFKVDFFRTTYHHLIEYFPIEHKEMSWVHGSVIGNMIYSLFKMINKPMAAKINLGCPFDTGGGGSSSSSTDCNNTDGNGNGNDDNDNDNGRIDGIFKQPNEQIAQQRLQEKMKTFLIERQYNRKYFRLQDASTAAAVAAAVAEDEDEDDDEGRSIMANDDDEDSIDDDEVDILAEDDDEDDDDYERRFRLSQFNSRI